MKKLLFLLIATALCVCALTGCSILLGGKTVTSDDGVIYALSWDQTYYSVSGYTEDVKADITIQSEYEGVPVTTIKSGAFYYCENLISITIPDSVTTIENNAFRCCMNLESVTFGIGVTYFGKIAFGDAYPFCSSLKQIVVDPDNPRYVVQDGILYDKEAKAIMYVPNKISGDITIMDGITSLDGFSCPSEEHTITLPNSITTIDNYDFGNSDGLISITIPESVTSISDSAFIGSSSLTSINVHENNPNYVSKDGILYKKEDMSIVHIPESITGEVTILDGVTQFESFSRFPKMESLILPDSIINLEHIGTCPSLTSITIGKGLTNIEGHIFQNCPNLTHINVADDNPTYIFINDCLIEKESGVLVRGTKSSIIPDDGSVTSIGQWAFDGCEGLTSITIPGSVKHIGRRAFRDCINLNSITICEGLESVDDLVFENCTSLTEVVFPEGLISIGDSFYDCTALTSVTFPGSIVSMVFPFSDSTCESLTEINFGGTKQAWEGLYKGSYLDEEYGKISYDWSGYLKNCVIHCTDGDIIK